MPTSSNQLFGFQSILQLLVQLPILVHCKKYLVEKNIKYDHPSNQKWRKLVNGSLTLILLKSGVAILLTMKSVSEPSGVILGMGEIVRLGLHLVLSACILIYFACELMIVSAHPEIFRLVGERCTLVPEETSYNPHTRRLLRDMFYSHLFYPFMFLTFPIVDESFDLFFPIQFDKLFDVKN